MELDDLRRQWQQPEPAALPVLTDLDLNALLKGRTIGLVEKMRRTAWLEIGYVVLMTIGMLAGWRLLRGSKIPGPFLNALVIMLLVLLVIMLVYYYRLLGVLKRMLEPANSVHQHLTTLAQGMRRLLNFYYRLTLCVEPVVMLLALGYSIGNKLAHPGPMDWSFPTGFVAGILVAGIPVQVATVYFTRWWMQRLYGQHLDRLEGQLRELEETPPAG